jgi:hypothetical protein
VKSSARHCRTLFDGARCGNRRHHTRQGGQRLLELRLLRLELRLLPSLLLRRLLRSLRDEDLVLLS